ncbi:MAG: adenine deaminase [Trueperaceae bacterium]|nr:adenine deaminase [Trueperaceae bacterium]
MSSVVGMGAVPADDRDALVAVALGERPADAVIRGGRLVNVYTGEVHPADVAILGDRIAAVGEVGRCLGQDTRVIEADGRYLVPGFIETHIHVGATSLTLTELARLLVPFGTAALVTDFTEAGKMRGKRAMRFFLDEANRTPLKAYFSPFYTTLMGIEGRPGASMEDLVEMLEWPECVELREWNVFAQRNDNPALAGLGRLARSYGKRLCGHLDGQAGPTLQASVAAGSLSDHEVATERELLERLRLGLAVQVRFSSGADNLGVLAALAREWVDTRNVMFATDEEDIDDLARLGHLDHRIRAAIGMGIPPVAAVQMATINAATYLGIGGDLGGIAPGRRAFVNLVDDLRRFAVTEVVAGSAVVARAGRYVGELAAPEYPGDFRDTIRLKAPPSAADFVVPAPVPSDEDGVAALVIDIRPYDVRTEALTMTLPVTAGAVTASPGLGVAKVAIAERHFASGKIGRGFVRGFGIARGAFGSSYHPGPLHLAVVGMDDHDMAVVAARVAELGGGFVAAVGGEVVAEVALPILGFLTSEPAEEVVEAFRVVKRAVRDELGGEFDGLFTGLAYLCMPGVLPDVRMTVDGPVNVRLGRDRLTVTSADAFPSPGAVGLEV